MLCPPGSVGRLLRTWVSPLADTGWSRSEGVRVGLLGPLSPPACWRNAPGGPLTPPNRAALSPHLPPGAGAWHSLERETSAAVLSEGGTAFHSLRDCLCGSLRGLRQVSEEPRWGQPAAPNAAWTLRRTGFQSRAGLPPFCVISALSWQRSTAGWGSLSQSPGNTPPHAHGGRGGAARGPSSP